MGGKRTRGELRMSDKPSAIDEPTMRVTLGAPEPVRESELEARDFGTISPLINQLDREFNLSSTAGQAEKTAKGLPPVTFNLERHEGDGPMRVHSQDSFDAQRELGHPFKLNGSVYHVVGSDLAHLEKIVGIDGSTLIDGKKVADLSYVPSTGVISFNRLGTNISINTRTDTVTAENERGRITRDAQGNRSYEENDNGTYRLKALKDSTGKQFEIDYTTIKEPQANFHGEPYSTSRQIISKVTVGNDSGMSLVFDSSNTLKEGGTALLQVKDGSVIQIEVPKHSKIATMIEYDANSGKFSTRTVAPSNGETRTVLTSRGARFSFSYNDIANELFVQPIPGLKLH
jgi:hypothetical protein